MFSVQFTNQAEEDLLSTLRYIVDVLKSPSAAKNLLLEIEQQTEILKSSPLCYSLVIDEYLSSRSIRSFLVKNYQIFYTVNDDKEIVSIIRILYARRDWAHLLQENN
jgi:toxin ParE1/3/4